MAATRADRDQASALASVLDLPCIEAETDLRQLAEPSLVLIVSAGALALQQVGRNAPGPVKVDFGAGAMRHRRRGGHNELLGKAVGVNRRPGLVIDATAGLGRDAFVLADLGCHVALCERDPVVFEMLRAGLEAARVSGDEWLVSVVKRMSLHGEDARRLAADVLARADVIYLDPMFSQRSKSAAVKKEMALFQQLLEPFEDDAGELLSWALAQDVARVVVKRPSRAEPLAGIPPSHQLSGKAVRFDVYSLRRL